MKSLFKSGTVALAAALLLAGPAVAAEPQAQAARSRLYLKIDGIPGESTSERHAGEIEIMSYSLGAMQSGTSGGGGGGGAGKVSFTDFAFTKTTDSASPSLLKSVATGTHHREAVFTAERGGRNQQPYLTIKLEDVQVSSFDTSGKASEGTSAERASLNFAKITVTSRAADGSPVTSCWNVKTASAC